MVYTDQVKVDFCRENSMTALVCVIVDNLPDCTGVAETLSDSNRMTGTPPTPDNNRSGVVTAPEK